MEFYMAGNNSMTIPAYLINTVTDELSISESFPAPRYNLLFDPPIYQVLIKVISGNTAIGFQDNQIYHARKSDYNKFTIHENRADAENNVNKFNFTQQNAANLILKVKFIDNVYPDNFCAFYGQPTLNKIVFTPDPEINPNYNQIYQSARIEVKNAYWANSGNISNQGANYSPSTGLGVNPNQKNIFVGDIDEMLTYHEGSFYSQLMNLSGVPGRIHFTAQNHLTIYDGKRILIQRLIGKGSGNIIHIPFSLTYSVKKGIGDIGITDSNANYFFNTEIFTIRAWDYETTITYYTTPP